MRKPKSYDVFIKAVLLAVVVLLCLIAAEATVRMFDIGPDIYPVYKNRFRISQNPVLQYELVPNAPEGALPINADGMRDKKYSYKKSGNTFRIACFGDSVCYGLGVAQSQTFSACLERVLNKYFSDTALNFEVMNFGVPGYNFRQITENIRVRTLQFHPDVVIYAYCLNDPQEFSWEFAGLLSELTDAQADYLNIFKYNNSGLRKSRLYLLIRYLVQSATYQGKKKIKLDCRDPQMLAIKRGSYIQYFSQLHQPESLPDTFKAGLNELKSVAATEGLPIQIFIFPVMKNIGTYPLASVHDYLVTLFTQHSFAACDLLPVFRQFQEKENIRMGLDALHPTPEGHEITALAMLYNLIAKEEIPGLKIDDFKKIAAADTSEGRYASVILEEKISGRFSFRPLDN